MSFRIVILFLALAILGVPVFGNERPNMVLIIADDISYNDLACYGSVDARTPNIDALAEQGLRFTKAFLTASSCSPSRSSIITGRYPHNLGDAAELHRPMAWHLPSFPGLLRDAGYHTAIAGKDHMTWNRPPKGSKPPTAPFVTKYGTKVEGNSGGHGEWRRALEECPDDQPFFLWLAALDAHRGWEGIKEWDETLYGPLYDPSAVTLPPALVDTRSTREDFAAYLAEVTRFDYFVGQVVAQLKESGQFDNTYLFVLADNGRPFPRAKTRLIDDGMQTYLIATGPAIQQPGTDCDSLVSVVDLAPTIVSLAGVEPAETFQGRSMTPVFADATAAIRPYAFSEHNWHDYEALGRSVRDGRWLLIRNFRPELPLQGPADSVHSDSFQDLLAAAASTEPIPPVQADVLMSPRPVVELYDTAGDPHQVQNLAADATYSPIMKGLDAALAKWMEVTGDSVPESISADSFDRISGNRLKIAKEDYQLPPPGADRGAERINDEGL